MKYVAPLARAAGLSIEETAAAIGIMANAGIQGSQAGTTLRGAISRFYRNRLSRCQSAWRVVGILLCGSVGRVKSVAESRPV